MKHMKKMMALVIAVVMVLAMTNMAVFAADENATVAYDHPITVTGLGTGDTAHFYQVIKWVGETSDKSDVSGWKAVSPFDTYLTKAKLTEILVGTPASGSQAAVPATGITSEIAGELAKLASGDGTVVNESSGTATLDNAESGMWMALIDPADANTVYNPVFVSADYNKDAAGTVAMTDSFADTVAKKSSIPLTKTAANAADYNKDNAKTTAVGDTVSFTVTTAIPAYGFVYTAPHFVISDTLTDLSLKTDTVALTAPTGLTKGTGTVDVKSTTADYFVEATTGGYTITFTEKYLKTVKSATDVTVTYDAIVTDTAKKAVNEENNDVYIEYSHNPNQQSDYDVKKDTTQHYTFSIDAEGAGEGQTVSGKKTSEIVKIGVDAAGNPITSKIETSAITSTEKWTGPLEGAVFGLFTAESCAEGTEYKAKKADGTPGDTAMTATTGSDGRMNFTGLDAGTYYLKEISAPAGYVTNTTVHTIVINAVTEEIEVTEYFKNGTWSSTNSDGAKAVTYKTDVLKSYSVTIDSQPTATYTFTNAAKSNTNEINWETAELVEHPFELTNTKGTELPSTGGIGTTIFYIVGAILVIGAGVLLVTRRRMNAS